MNKKKRPVKVVSMPPPKPSPKQMENFELLAKILKISQYSKSAHPALLDKMMALYNKLPAAEFMSAFQTCLRVPFLRLEKDPAVDRTLEFVSGFCTTLNASLDTEKTGDLCPFLERVFYYLLENSRADVTSIRYRICQLINFLLTGLGEGVGLEETLANDITDALLKRVQDKAPAVRAQAVLSLERLQDPSDQHCKVIQAFVFHMEHDPSPTVRLQAMQSVAKTRQTIQLLYERHLDQTDAVRQVAVLVLSKIHIRSLKIAQRDTVLYQVLLDTSALVRQRAENILLPAWFNCLEKDYVAFLHCLDLETEKGVKTCLLAINTLFKSESTESLVSTVVALQKDKVVPIGPEVSNCSEKVFLWRCLVAHLRERGEEEALEAVLPELTPFCAYVRQSLLETQWPDEDDEFEAGDVTFILLQFVEIVKGFDLADEMGRSSLYSLVLDLLASPSIHNTAIRGLSELTVLIEPNVTARLQRLAELISDIYSPLEQTTQAPVVTEGDFQQLTVRKAHLRVKAMEMGTNQETAIKDGAFLLAQKLEVEMTELRAQLAEINEQLSTVDREASRKDTTDPTLLTKCLEIVSEMMGSVDVKAFTPHLRSLMNDFVVRIYESETNVAVRALCLKCYARFCFLDLDLAKEKIPVFYCQIADGEENSQIGVVALTAIFDLYFLYDLPTFGMQDDIDASLEPKSDSQEAVTIASDSDSSLSGSSTGILHTLYNIFTDKGCPLLHPVTALGFCKLLLAGRVNSFRLVSQLFLVWHWPALDKAMLKTLSCFFQIFSANREVGIQLMIQAFVPTLEALVEAPHDSPLADVNITSAMALLVNLTKTGINPNVTQNYHNNLAVVLLNRILSDPTSDLVIFIAEALVKLQVTVESEAQLDLLVGLADRVAKKVTYDKTTLKHATKFYMTLRQMEPDVEESDSSLASKNQSVLTSPEATTPARSVRMETIVEDSPSSVMDNAERPEVPMVVSETEESESE